MRRSVGGEVRRDLLGFGSAPSRGLGGERGTGPQSELGEDVFEVGLHGRSAHEEVLGDLHVGHALRDERHDPVFGRCEAGPAVVRSFPFAPSAAGVGAGLAPIELSAFHGSARRLIAKGVDGVAPSVVHGSTFERKPPPVAGLLAETLGRAEEPQALGPALGSAGGGGEPFQGIDGNESEAVVEGDGEGVVPAILVTGCGALDRGDNGPRMGFRSRPVARPVNGNPWRAGVDRFPTYKPGVEQVGGCCARELFATLGRPWSRPSR